SMQIDQTERGFSFNKSARLDMRMSQQGISAWEVINQYSEEDLADIIYYYGEETFARRIAKKIVNSRPINTTTELASVIQEVVRQKGKINPATKTFQAIRVFVNDELKTLKKALAAAYDLLKVNGKIVIVSFQGLEDRIVKDFIKDNSLKSSKIIKPSFDEIKNNPRSRSAKLRTIIKAGGNQND
ncbi:MAG: 16S rRNA (cytosine(1402)-N(4))-methyltransferase RsmH, partial [Pseudomonadota bacterium]